MRGLRHIGDLQVLEDERPILLDELARLLKPRRITPGSKYTVQAGDTLWDIAQRAYNDPEDWDTIYDANKHVIGNDPNLIKPGQVLQIPSQSDPDKRQPVPPHLVSPHVVPPPLSQTLFWEATSSQEVKYPDVP